MFILRRSSISVVFSIFFVTFVCNGSEKSVGVPSAQAELIAGINPADASYPDRYRAVAKLKHNITLVDQATYVSFLSSPLSSTNLPERTFAALKNDLADKLLALDTVPAGLSSCFLNGYNDYELGIVWRNYIIQKLDDLYKKANADEHQQIISILWNATDSTELSIPGTALLTLKRMSKSEIVDKIKVGEKAITVAKKTALTPDDRLTALQVANECGNLQSLGLARELLKSTQSAQMKMACIHVIGTMGSVEDIKLLEHCSKSPDMRIRGASKIALASLSARLEPH